MNKKMVRVISIVIAALLVLGLLGPLAYTFVFSAPMDDNLAYIQQEKTITLSDIATLEADLNAAEEKVRQLNETINESAKGLEEIDEKSKEAQQLMKKYNDESGRRFRVMCEKGMMSYLDIIFSSTSLTDFADRIVIAKELAEYDKGIMQSIKDVNNELESKKEKTEKYLKEQQEAIKEIEAAKTELEIKKAKSAETLAQLQKDEKAYIQYIEQKENEETSFRSNYSSNGTVAVSDIPVGTFAWPTASKVITSKFSPSRVNPVSGKVLPHTGTDIAGNMGDPIVAAASGKVTFAGANSGYGNCVMIDHGNGVSTLYAHMSSIITSSGSDVIKGDIIGRVGSTGNSTGPHLHFEVLLGGTPVDAMLFF